MVYAGFWRRVAAGFVDSRTGGVHTRTAHGLAAIGPWNVAFRAAYWLYFAGMESSPLQATLGKRALAIVVTDGEGNRISFAHATGRPTRRRAWSRSGSTSWSPPTWTRCAWAGSRRWWRAPTSSIGPRIRWREAG